MLSIVRGLLLTAVVCALPVTNLVAAEDEPAMPERIREGFDLLADGRARDALLAWGEGSGWTNQQEFIKSTTMVLDVEARALGDFLRPEQIATVDLTPSISLHWYALVYERGVLYLWFELLDRDGVEVVTSMSRYSDVRELSVSLSLFEALLEP